MEGTIKWFGGVGKDGQPRRYGFIAGDDGRDVFVHLNEVQDGVGLREGDRVSFQIEEKDNRRKALGVRVIRVMYRKRGNMGISKKNRRDENRKFYLGVAKKKEPMKAYVDKEYKMKGRNNSHKDSR